MRRNEATLSWLYVGASLHPPLIGSRRTKPTSVPDRMPRLGTTIVDDDAEDENVDDFDGENHYVGGPRNGGSETAGLLARQPQHQHPRQQVQRRHHSPQSSSFFAAASAAAAASEDRTAFGAPPPGGRVYARTAALPRLSWMTVAAACVGLWILHNLLFHVRVVCWAGGHQSYHGDGPAGKPASQPAGARGRQFFVH